MSDTSKAALKKHQFKPGQSGNPSGKGGHLGGTMQALRRITIDSYREIIEKVLTGNIQDLQAIIKDPNTTALQVGIANAFAKAIKNGDYQVIERIAERLVGKIPDVVQVSSSNLNLNVQAEITKKKLRAVLDELESDI